MSNAINVNVLSNLERSGHWGVLYAKSAWTPLIAACIYIYYSFCELICAFSYRIRI